MGEEVRKTPCASCPYRKSVPSGVWEEEEYEKLKGYDGDTATQNPHAFSCHQGDGKLCAGWAGHRDAYDLLAMRLGIAFGAINPDAINYSTTVPLFASGAEAAEHGMRDIEHPSPKAIAMAQKIVRKQEL